MIDGQLYQKSLKTTNKRLAEKLAEAYKQEVLEGAIVEKQNHISIYDAIELYKSDRPTKGHKVYSDWMTNFLQDNGIDISEPLTKITTAVLHKVVQIRKDEGRSPATVRHTVGFLGRLISHAKKHGYEVADVEMPIVKVKNKKLVWFTFEDEKKILQELDYKRNIPTLPPYEENPNHFRRIEMQDNYEFFQILIDTGLRLNELAMMKWSDVNLRKSELSIYRPKVNNQSVIHMTKRVKEILERRSKTNRSEWVFTNEKGDGCKRTFSTIRAAIKRAGFTEGTIHTCRHSYASRLVQAGVQLYDVSQILGHTSMSMTTRYAHLNKVEISKNAANVLDNIVKDSKVVKDNQPDGYYKINTNKSPDISIFQAKTGSISESTEGLVIPNQ
jgi:integrase